MNYGETLKNLWNTSGLAAFQWQNVVMLVIACVFLYLGIEKQFEPLLLVGIAFGMLLTNLPIESNSGDIIFRSGWWNGKDLAASVVLADGTVEGINYTYVLQHGGLLDILYIGVKAGIYPCLIFMGVGAMTDFGPLLSNPKSLILGAAAQLGVYVAFFLAVCIG
ncbi:MAG: sodium ion-translocating decarboxylase subunit beta, partial [Clostridia bacterium]|nr:sodium ion-translocating decarboxylase subunit beta [Clostridia bacterium]